MKQNMHFKRLISVVLSVLMLASMLPLSIFAVAGDATTPIATYDTVYEQILSAVGTADRETQLDFTNSNYEFSGFLAGPAETWDSSATQIWAYIENGTVQLASENSSTMWNHFQNNAVITNSDSKYSNAFGVRLSEANGSYINVAFVAPENGKYHLKPLGITAAGGKSMLLQKGNNGGTDLEHYNQTLKITQGANTLFTKTLALGENYADATDDLPSDLTVTLAKGEKLEFNFTSSADWDRTELYINFEIELMEYTSTAVEAVSFAKDGYLVEKSDTTLNIAPVVTPSSAADKSVTYTVEDEDVLSVDKDGNVTPKAEGFTKVTATTTDGGFTAETTVGVYDETKASVYTMSSYKTETGALLSNASTADNTATNAWQGMYKKVDGTWARMEKLYKSANDIVSHPNAVLTGETHNYPNLTQFGANDDDEVMLNFGHGNIDYKAEDASDLRTYIRRGTALVFTAQKDGIYSFASDEPIAFTNKTLNYMTRDDGMSDDHARASTTTITFYLNGSKYGRELTLGYDKQVLSVDFPTANCISMKQGDTFMIELASTCWQDCQISMSPRAVWLFEKMPEKPVESVTLTDESITLSKGATHSLVASVLPETASDKTLVYTSSDESVVTVSDAGVITAVSGGKATVTATSKSTLTVSDSVEVKVLFDNERFLNELWDSALGATSAENTLESAVYNGAFSTGVLKNGKYNDFSFALRHDWGNPRAVLYTSDERETGQTTSNQYLSLYNDSGKKASISSYIDGENVYVGYRAQKNGKYTISAADGAPNILLMPVRVPSKDENDVPYTYEQKIEMLKNWGEDKPTGIRITKNGQKIWPADVESVELKPSGLLEIAFPTLENVTLYKGDVIRFEVIGQSGVNRHVSVVFDFNVRFEENVLMETPVTGVTLSHEKIDLYESETATLTTVVAPENATNKNVRYESSDESVATVSQEGVVTGLSVGTATIYAISLDNEEIKDSCTVSVKKSYPAEEMLKNLWNDALNATTEEGVPTNKTYEGNFFAGTVASDGYYTDFPYVLRQSWGTPRAVLYMPNNEEYSDTPDNSISIYDNKGKDTIDIFPYTDGVATYVAFRAEENGIYDIKAVEGFENILLQYRRSATAEEMVKWGEDAPIKIKITKNGKQIWPASGETILAPSGKQSVAFPTLSGLKLYKGDTVRVEVLGGAKLNHHVSVSLNFSVQLKDVLAVDKPVTGVKFAKSAYSISKFDSLFIGASVVPSTANNQNLIYSSSNPDIVSVNPYGVVTGNKEGKATIYAKSVENPSLTASCVVTVKKAYESQSMIKNLWDAALTLAQTESELVRATYDSGFVAGRLDVDGLYNDFSYVLRQDWGTPRAVLYTSDTNETGSGQSNQYLSLYDSKGDKAAVGSYVDGESVYVGYRAQSNGKYTISAAKGCENIEMLFVRGANAKDMIKWGEDKPIYIKITKNGQKIWPENAEGFELRVSKAQSTPFPTIENVLLYKGDTLRVEVVGQSGVNRHINIGFAFDVKKTEDISVKNPVKSISLDSTKCTLSIDEVYQLNATISPANADNKNVRFVSSDPSVAVVDSLGRITALSEGTATVFATSEDNESIKASCAVTVSSFRIIHYSPDELKVDLDSQLKGSEIVDAKPVEFGTNWTPQYSLDGGKTWETLGALNTTIYENNKAGDLSSYSFRWTNKDSVGLEKYYGTYQPFMTTEGTTMALAFTATRAGTYSISGDERNPFIHLPATYTGGRVPAEDADKEFLFAIYHNDKLLYSKGLSVKNNSVAFPEISGIKMNANDVIRFVMFDNEKASSQMAFYFYPRVSLVKPDPRELAPVTESKLYILEPNKEFKGTIKAVHPNGLPINYQVISKGTGGTLTIQPDGKFTYKPRKDYKGIDTFRVKCADSRGLFSIATLTFMVSVKFDAVADLSATCISMDDKFTGEATPLTFPEYGWKYQFTYDGLTYANGAPQYMSTNTTQVIKNPGWWGYVMYSGGMPQATVEAMDGTAVVNCMAGHEPWGVNPIGAVSFIAPYDATWLLKGSDLFNKFKIGTDPENPEFKKPVKVWISKNGQKIWPADADYLEISKETREIEFPELTVAMKQGDSVRVCISGHVDNLRLNRVAVAPVIYDIGAYDAKLDPYAIPEAGIVITDDDGEPIVRYGNYKADEKSLSLLREGLLEPINGKGVTVNKIKKLLQLDKFKLGVEFEKCENAYGYRVLVYSVKEGAYKAFSDTTVYELSAEIAGLDAGDYVVQVIALDSLGQFIEIYSPRSFSVDENGQIEAQNGISVLTIIIIALAALVVLAAAALLYVFLIKKRTAMPKEA